MAPKLLVGLVLTPLAAAVQDGVPDMDGKCHSLLTAMSAAPHSTTELSMICRAHLPMGLCHSAVRELGQKPWSKAKVDHTCARWEDQWEARELKMTPAERKLDAMDFQGQIDDVMAKKAAVGLCKDQTINECAAYKKEEYPKYQSEMNDVMKQKRGGASDSIKESTEQASDAIEDASDQTSDALEDAGEKTSDAIDEISSKASSAMDDVSDGTSDAIDAMSSKTKSKARRAQQKERVVRKLEDTAGGKKDPTSSIDTGAVEEAAGDATEGIDTGAVEEAVGDATEAVNDAVEDATEEVDSAAEEVDSAEGDSVEDAAEEVDSEVDSAASEASDAVTDAVSEAPSEDGNPMDRIKPRRADQKYQTLGKISPVSSSPFMLAAAGAAALAIAGAALIIARRRKARGLVTVPRAVPELQPIE